MMRKVCLAAVLVGLLVAASAGADETFSSRRTLETEVSVYRRGYYPVYGHRFIPARPSAYAGARLYTARRASTSPRYQWGTLGRTRPYYTGRYPSRAGWEFTYNRKVKVEEEATWSGRPPYGLTTWPYYRYPGYGYYGYYELPYAVGPYPYYSYRRPIGHRFLPERFPAGYYRSYYYPYGGTAIDIRLRW